MSRTHYSDDYGEDFSGQLELYRANVDRSMSSARGRVMLREILGALDAMPVRELYADVFVETRDTPEADDRQTMAPKGAACGLGAWAIDKLGPDRASALFADPVPSSVEIAARLKVLGWPALVVHEIVYENDHEDHRWRNLYVLGPLTEAEDRQRRRYGRNPTDRFVCYRVEELPAERWQRVRDWIAERLATFETWDRNEAAWKATHPYTTPSPSGVGLL